MKRIQFNITFANFKQYILERTGGRTSFPTTGYVYAHKQHASRLMAVSRTRLINQEEGVTPSKHSWWVYDVESGFRIPPLASIGVKARTREEAMEVVGEILNAIDHDAIERYIAHKRLGLAQLLLEQ